MLRQERRYPDVSVEMNLWGYIPQTEKQALLAKENLAGMEFHLEEKKVHSLKTN